MRDLAFIAVIFGISAENRGGKRKYQLRVGEFIGLECEIGKGNKAGYNILS